MEKMKKELQELINEMKELVKRGEDAIISVSEERKFVNDVKIVSWEHGSWEDIGKMLDAHYEGKINITKYWNIGDTKKVHLEEIRGTNDIHEYHNSQYIELTIIGFNHDYLVVPVNGAVKSAVTIQTKNCLEILGQMFDDYDPRFSLWIESPRREWCNNDFKEALPKGLTNLIKKVIKQNYRGGTVDGHPYNMLYTTEDNIFLLSEMEVFGEEILPGCYIECLSIDGIHYEYYKKPFNRYKKRLKNGEYIDTAWWLRSSYVSSYYTSTGCSNFCFVGASGENFSNFPISKYGLAPALCI